MRSLTSQISRWLNARSLLNPGQIGGKVCSGSGEVPLALVPCVPPAFLEPELLLASIHPY